MEEKDLQKTMYRKGMRRGIIGTIIVCAVLVFAGGMFLNHSGSKTRIRVQATEDGKQVTKVLSYDSLLDQSTVDKINYLAADIQANYYEDVDVDAMKEGLYQGLFNALDQYSQYFTKEEYDELMKSDVSGSYSGIGATLNQNSDTKQVTVVSVQDGSPAQEAGIQAGDVIVKADDYTAADMELSEFVSHLKGEEGTKVTVQIYRSSDHSYKDLTLTRKSLEIKTVDSQMLENNVGYIRITEFVQTTTGQFETALNDLKAQGMTSLIVDLRSNPGGLVSSVTDILQNIIPKGMIVYTEDKYNNRNEYQSTGEKQLDMPLVVLINENSASASEIFAGAVKDRQCGTLIGTTTFGKGIVQGIQNLSDGSGAKMTTSRYYTPNGVCIQGKGIEPDITLEYQFLGNDDQAYSYSLDNQIQKALEVLKDQK